MGHVKARRARIVGARPPGVIDDQKLSLDFGTHGNRVGSRGNAS